MPIHISKPYWDGHSLLLNVMSPTAGLLEGDEIEMVVRIREKATLVLSNPTALRIHKMSANGGAELKQRFSIESGAYLEAHPEWLILQAESSFTQTTRIDVACGAELFYLESIAPGRVAHGEAFAFRRFRNRLELRYDDSLVACEKHAISTKDDTHLPWSRAPFSPSFFVSIFLVSERLNVDSPLWPLVYEMQNETIRIGASELANPHCWNIRILSREPSDARRAIQTLRSAFYQYIDRPIPNLRRQ